MVAVRASAGACEPDAKFRVRSYRFRSASGRSRAVIRTLAVMHKNWQDLIRPAKLEVSFNDASHRVATLIAEPLERGFGTTLGNALRRVLLSSLQGAAITGVQIDGVVHEFSSIPGVREDVTDIVLNLKRVAIRMVSDTPKRMTLKATGGG